MKLSEENTALIPKGTVEMPDPGLFQLPEKVIQFGTGVLLRGLPDYFIDKANKRGLFKGRIIVVKSTGNGVTDDFTLQDGLYTQILKGVRQGETVQETVLNSSISRVISARSEWAQFLACATSQDLQLIISNTTEVGLTFDPNDPITAIPPVSFPGKLVAFLYERFKAFSGSDESGLVIVPTELIPNNGQILKASCLSVAETANLEPSFLTWLLTANEFCNSLVDRIVPGKLSPLENDAFFQLHGYSDALAINSEIYGLWAIETSSEKAKQALAFSAADEGVVLADSIEKFRELKLRLLNGAHTFACGLAVLSGFRTVKEAMQQPDFEQFITQLMHDEIAPTLVGDVISEAEATRFADQVLDRFRNPFLEHAWLSITLQFTSKMRTRNVPTLLSYYERKGSVPKGMALGFGAYIVFMRSQPTDQGFVGEWAGTSYVIQDDRTETLSQAWKGGNPHEAVHSILTNELLWGTNLAQLPGFEEAVNAAIEELIRKNSAVI